MTTVVLLNAANGVYQGSLYGLTANFPPQYTNALILGNNICGTFVSVVNIVTLVGKLHYLDSSMVGGILMRKVTNFELMSIC